MLEHEKRKWRKREKHTEDKILERRIGNGAKVMMEEVKPEGR